MTAPTNIPKGFYRHYKHDPTVDFNNYTYEVIGLGRNTEEKDDKEYTVLYRPLYKNDWMEPALYQSRPYTMFIEKINKNGDIIPRFTLITDQETISKLEEVKDQMYQ
jgi:hypothetical protein